MKLSTRMLPLIRGLYIATSTILYCGMTIVCSLLIFLLAILSMQKDISAGDMFSIEAILGAQNTFFISSLELAVIFFILVPICDIFLETRNTDLTGLKRFPLLIVRIITAAVFYGIMYYFALQKPEIFYDGVMINFLEFLFATYIFTTVTRVIIKDFTDSTRPLILRDYLNTLNKDERVEIIVSSSSDGVYTAGELLEKAHDYLNCIIEPQSISINRDSALNCIALDSKEYTHTVEILKDNDISYLAIELQPLTARCKQVKGIKGDRDSNREEFFTEDNINPLAERKVKACPDDSSTSSPVSENEYEELFTVPEASSDSEFKIEMLFKIYKFNRWIEPILKSQEPFFKDMQTYIAEKIYIVCMTAAYINNRNSDIYEFAKCINNYEELNSRIQSIEEHYNIPNNINKEYINNNDEILDIAKDLLSIKKKFLYPETDKNFEYARELRNNINKIIADM